MLWLQRIKCQLLNDISLIIILLLKIQGKKSESRKRRTTQVPETIYPLIKDGSFLKPDILAFHWEKLGNNWDQKVKSETKEKAKYDYW